LIKRRIDSGWLGITPNDRTSPSGFATVLECDEIDFLVVTGFRYAGLRAACE